MGIRDLNLKEFLIIKLSCPKPKRIQSMRKTNHQEKFLGIFFLFYMMIKIYKHIEISAI